MPSPRLKPCPFCQLDQAEGATLVPPARIRIAFDMWTRDFKPKPPFHIYCERCGACGPEAATEQKAVAAWNKRAVDPAAIIKAGRGMKKRLEDLIDIFGAFYEDGRIEHGCAMANINAIKRAVAAWNRRAGEDGK